MFKEVSFLRFSHQKSLFFLATGILASAFYGGVDACLVRLIKHLLDDGFVQQDQSFLSVLPYYLVLFFVIRSVAGFFSQYFMAVASVTSTAFLRKHLLGKILRYPSSVYQKHPTGELMNRVIYSTQVLCQLTSEFFSILIREGVTIVGLVIVMLLSSVHFTFIYLATLPFSLIILSKVGAKARKNNISANETTEKLSTHLQQLIQSEQVVKSFGAQQFEHNRFSALVEKNSLHELKQFKAVSLGSSLVQFIGGIALTLIIYLSLSPYLPPISAGEFTCLITAILALLRPIKQMTKLNGDWQKISSYCKQLEEMLSWSLEADSHKEALASVKGHICFDEVSFKYSNNREEEILSGINLDVKPGSTVAIIGPSGGGKTTLISLLPRFYEIFSGSIKIDGTDIKKFPLGQLRSLISLVGQDIRLLDGSILSNIAYGDPNPCLEEAKIAAKLAHADNFIMELENSYYTSIGENGTLLSGGQRQRLAIARAFYKKAPILILDEATSALDHESEEKVQQALQSLMSNSTTLVIAHKLKTIINADLIVVIDKGCIIEIGDHQSLMQKKGFYFQMHKGNFLHADVDLESLDTLSGF